MLKFEIRRYIFNNYKKLIVSFFILILLSFYSLSSIPYLYLPDGANINFGDYLVGELNMIQLIMFIAYPSIFSFLTANLIRKDFEDNYIELIFSRSKNKFSYLLNKFILLFIISICFTVVIVFLKFIISLILKISFTNNCYNYVFATLKYDSVYEVYFCNIILFTIGLIFIGMVSLLLSIYIKNSGFTIGVVIFLGFLHNAVFMSGGKFIYLLPFTQYILILHRECGSILTNFTLTFSYIYMIAIIVLSFFIILRALNKKETGDFLI